MSPAEEWDMRTSSRSDAYDAWASPNDYAGHAKTITAKAGGATTVSWPADQYGYYDVVITTDTAGRFRRRYAGRIA